MQLDPEALAAWVPRLAGRRVLVLGDPVLDRYVLGSTHRISREAPVLIVREDETQSRLGGAANTAANLAALGAQVTLLGLVGADPDGRELGALAAGQGIRLEALSPPDFRTIVKTRILAGALHTRRQQMLRIDRGPPAPFDPSQLAELHQERTHALLSGQDALIISDYSEGYSMTPLYRRAGETAKALGLPVVVDSRSAIQAYPGVTAVTPNEPEIRAAVPDPGPWDASAAVRSARRLQETLGCRSVLLTRGREGMAIVDRDRAWLLRAHGPEEAVDVTGAGDTVVAAFTLALAAGASTVEAAALANCAASITVQQTGAATVRPEALAATARALHPDALSEPRP